jgi:hypothetical protein
MINLQNIVNYSIIIASFQLHLVRCHGIKTFKPSIIAVAPATDENMAWIKQSYANVKQKYFRAPIILWSQCVMHAFNALILITWL